MQEIHFKIAFGGIFFPPIPAIPGAVMISGVSMERNSAFTGGAAIDAIGELHDIAVKRRRPCHAV